MKGAKERLKRFKLYKIGTYSLDTGQAVTFTYGFQFSFVRKEAFEQLNDDDWDLLTEYLSEKTGSEEYIGVYAGQAETSFYTKDKDVAFHYADKFNQETIFDWKSFSNGEPESSYYLNNPTYNESAEVNYDKIIEEIQQHKKEV